MEWQLFESKSNQPPFISFILAGTTFRTRLDGTFGLVRRTLGSKLGKTLLFAINGFPILDNELIIEKYGEEIDIYEN